MRRHLIQASIFCVLCFAGCKRSYNDSIPHKGLESYNSFEKPKPFQNYIKPPKAERLQSYEQSEVKQSLEAYKNPVKPEELATYQDTPERSNEVAKWADIDRYLIYMSSFEDLCALARGTAFKVVDKPLILPPDLKSTVEAMMDAASPVNKSMTCADVGQALRARTSLDLSGDKVKTILPLTTMLRTSGYKVRTINLSLNNSLTSIAGLDVLQLDSVQMCGNRLKDKSCPARWCQGVEFECQNMGSVTCKKVQTDFLRAIRDADGWKLSDGSQKFYPINYGERADLAELTASFLVSQRVAKYCQGNEIIFFLNDHDDPTQTESKPEYNCTDFDPAALAVQNNGTSWVVAANGKTIYSANGRKDYAMAAKANLQKYHFDSKCFPYGALSDQYAYWKRTPRPDLIVESMSYKLGDLETSDRYHIPYSVLGSNVDIKFSVKYRIRNIGYAPAKLFKVRAVVDGHFLHGTHLVNGLAAGDTIEFTDERLLRISAAVVFPLLHKIEIRADADSRIAELSESNNSKFSSFNVDLYFGGTEESYKKQLKTLIIPK